VPRHPNTWRREPMHPVARHSRGRAAAAGRQVLAVYSEVDVEPVRLGNEQSRCTAKVMYSRCDWETSSRGARHC
jgi:hypothetical protein